MGRPGRVCPSPTGLVNSGARSGLRRSARAARAGGRIGRAVAADDDHRSLALAIWPATWRFDGRSSVARTVAAWRVGRHATARGASSAGRRCDVVAQLEAAPARPAERAPYPAPVPAPGGCARWPSRSTSSRRSTSRWVSMPWRMITGARSGWCWPLTTQQRHAIEPGVGQAVDGVRDAWARW